MTKLSRNLTLTSKHPLIDFDLTASWLVLTQRIGSAWISNLKSLSQFAMYMYDSMAQVIIHVAYHCLIKSNTEWDKLHGWQVLWGDYDHSKSREDGNCPVLKKGMTTQNQKLKVGKIHQAFSGVWSSNLACIFGWLCSFMMQANRLFVLTACYSYYLTKSVLTIPIL